MSESPEPPFVATYRVQLTPEFGFDQAVAQADYWSALGISHLYCSPYLAAHPGSQHGYDVISHSRPNPELGGDEGRVRLGQALARHGMGQVLDIVPNHMAATCRNAIWQEVLRNGRFSPYAHFFDIDWAAPQSRLRGRVVLPILGDHYGRALRAGQLELQRAGGSFGFRYFEEVLPLAPDTLPELLSPAAQKCESDELAFLADALGRLPRDLSGESMAARYRDEQVLYAQLSRLLEENSTAAAAVDHVILEINRQTEKLDGLLSRQYYRPAYWRSSLSELNYRRFFNISTLVALRVEEPEVFAESHARVLDWVREGYLQGLRVDHIDGLRDPLQYLRRLRSAAPEAWIVLEKILARGERLPDAWPVAGTTGYDFMNQVGGLFVDPAAERRLSEFNRAFTGEPRDFAEVVHQQKLVMLRQFFDADIQRLTEMLLEATQNSLLYRDLSRRDLHNATRELLACFPVYRTYIRAAPEEIARADRRYVGQAVEMARLNEPDLDPLVWELLRDLLLLRLTGQVEAEFVMRFQQLCVPTMAKGVEDTAFYRFSRLLSLNEVGGDPGKFGTSVTEFHSYCTELQQRWPETMVTTSTHDTKRGEDTRIRISLLSEVPQEWTEAVRRWAAINERHRRGSLPDRSGEYQLYQTLVGAWPIGLGRLWPVMLKAAREAKSGTSWINPVAEYEEALQAFVTGVVQDGEFVADFQRFLSPLLEPAYVSSLAQTLIKYTAPGIPDLYQGAELWDLRLVDPDNRLPVDYGVRRRLLAELEGLTPEEVWSRAESGLPKLFVIQRTLQFRRRRMRLFERGASYKPVLAEGERSDHVVAFLRGEQALTVVPRLVIGLRGDWSETSVTVPEGDWRNVFTGEPVRGGRVRIAALLKRFPVALLEHLGDDG
jgi:(1->4)-alpha-D-glucan 1-alpha-D-glucosylmutase